MCIGMMYEYKELFREMAVSTDAPTGGLCIYLIINVLPRSLSLPISFSLPLSLSLVLTLSLPLSLSLSLTLTLSSSLSLPASVAQRSSLPCVGARPYFPGGATREMELAEFFCPFVKRRCETSAAASKRPFCSQTDVSDPRDQHQQQALFTQASSARAVSSIVSSYVCGKLNKYTFFNTPLSFSP